MAVQNNEYEINPQTMALIAKQGDDGQVFTEVVERRACFEVPKCPHEVIDDSCRYFANSLEGRISGTKQVTNYTHKPPIVISEAMGIYFFPIVSPTRKDCSWIAQKYIRDYDGEPDHTTTVLFANGMSVNFPVSAGMIANQIQRTAHLRIIMEDRFHSSQTVRDDRDDRDDGGAETF